MRTVPASDVPRSASIRAFLVATGDVPPALAMLAPLGESPSQAVDLDIVRPEQVAPRVRRDEPDVVVIDGSERRALASVRAARAASPQLPILFLAATLDDVAAAVSVGATDFVAHPATAAEVALRLRLLVTGSGRASRAVRQLGPLRLERESRRLIHGDRAVSLSPIELKLLERLLLQSGKPVSRAELQRSIWPQDAIDQHPTNIAVVYVSYLRAKLSRLGAACSIRTITNVGYVLDVAPAEDSVLPAPRRRSAH